MNLQQKIAVVGRGYAGKITDLFPELTLGEGNPREFLRSPKSRKFMGKQDLLAVCALGRALAGLEFDTQTTGIYMTVGYVPFDKDTLMKLARLSSNEDHTFSVQEFTSKAIRRFNPLLTFRCLPNMPVYHTSVNFGICGPSYVSYPTVGEFYRTLDRAILDLISGKTQLAAVGGCADQDNFLAGHRLEKFLPQGLAFANSAAFIILERLQQAHEKSHEIYYVLQDYSLDYSPHHRDYQEHFDSIAATVYLGPGSLATFLNTNRASLHHSGNSPSGYKFTSAWEKYNP